MNSIHMYKARSIWYLQQFLSIWDSLMPCMVHFFFEKKDDFSWTISSLCMPQLEKFLIIWQVFYPYVQGKKHWVSSTCPNLKDSLLYDRFSIHMYKARSIRYLQQFSSICVSLMPCTVHFFGKRWFFMKYFKLVQAPTWKIPYYMTGFLSICSRHKGFGIFNNFPLSATPSYPVRYIFLEKDEFLMKYFKLVHAPSWKIPQYMKIYLTFLCYLRLPNAL